MQILAEARTEEDLLTKLLDVAIEQVRTTRGAITRLNLDTGELDIVSYLGPTLGRRSLLPGQGLMNESLRRGNPILADDVRQYPWNRYYADFWPDTRSELAVPIVLTNAAVLRGTETVRSSKPFGVLNLESAAVGAFLQTDADLLLSLARYSAVLLDRIESERKQAALGKVHEQILEQTDWSETIDIMMHAIKNTLSYPYVNISLVKPDVGRIQTEYVIGIPPQDVEHFKKLADHSLDSTDIQADIVRARRVEAPGPNDSRYDPDVYDRFGHNDLVRVFLPMIAPKDNEVIGTVEAGCRRSLHRQDVYEEDVRILKGFIEYGARALERRQSYVLDKLGHEFRAPVAGIRNNARYVQMRVSSLAPEMMVRKCDDIITDCEILLSQIARLEHILGKRPPLPKITPTLVARDVIIKTVRQLKPELVREKLDPDGIIYADEIHRLGTLHIDRARLNQVFYNLLTNAIKYVEADRSTFRVRITLEDGGAAWLINVQDWGIGIRPEHRDRIFEEGFRTPEARDRNPTGSGLGLSISRQVMREMDGGDLLLTMLAKPTQFQVVLPKKLARRSPGVHT